MFVRITLLVLATAIGTAPVGRSGVQPGVEQGAQTSVQANTFELQASMHSIGSATYTLLPAAQGFTLFSHVTYHFDDVDSEFSNKFKYSPVYAYLEGLFSIDAIETHTSMVPNPARTVLLFDEVHRDAHHPHEVSIKPGLVVLPPFDPGAAQVLLLLATAHPAEKNLYSVVIPAIRGRGGAAGSEAPLPERTEGPSVRQSTARVALEAVWAKGPDTTSSLDGKLIGVHTYILTAGRITWTFFADDANNLMQLNNSMLHVNYVRAKFKLDPSQ
jgi:hypothetical protein